MFTLLFGNYNFPNQTFEIDGLPLDINIQEDVIPGRDGSVIQTGYLKSRTIKIKGTIHNASAEDSHAELIAMQAALLAEENEFQYRADRYINCRIKSLKPAFVEGTDKAVIDVDIQFVAQDPFLYSTGAAYIVTQNAVKGTTLSFDIFSYGNVFVEPKFSFCATGGTISDDIYLKNSTNNDQYFRFRGIIPDGATLEIDAAELTATNNLIDGITNFDGDFITMLPGTNSFIFVGGTCRLTTEYKGRWY